MPPPQTFAQKALARAAGKEYAAIGDILEVRPHRVLSHDNTAAIARIFYEELGARRVADPRKLVITLDHASPPPTPRHAQNHAETRAFVQAQGVHHFFDVGHGICHQVIAEEGLILPGQVILGADSHTTHAGWLGAFGAGVGRSEVAALWATGRLWLRVPRAIRVVLEGHLPPDVSAKDLALYLIGALGADGGSYASVEFCGPGLSTLSLESRMVLPNMMAEFGVKNAYLPPDEAVFAFLAPRCGVPRAELRRMALYPDPDAPYAAEYILRMDRLRPQVACPHRVNNVRPLAEVNGKPVDMAFIGTCTNGRVEDLEAAARVLSGRRVHPNTRLLIIPASSHVLKQALARGIIQNLIEAGAVLGTPGCGPCMGNHAGIPAAGEVVLSTANRNFRGRMGQPEAEIYLASPAVVAASALEGRIVGDAISEGSSPLIVKTALDSVPGEEAAPGRILPPQDQQQIHPQGAAWKYGDHVNTDQIFPGKYTYTLRTPEEITPHALEDLDPAFAARVQPGDVIFAGSNFGNGSSREQAVTCLVYKGVAAVIAKSFARIFYRNAINRGLPVIVCPQAVDAAQSGDPVRLDLENGRIHLPAGVFTFAPFPPHLQAILRAGGLIPALRASMEAIP